MSKNSDKALDVIGQKLRLKEEIDAPFDEKEVAKQTIEIAPAPKDESTARISYKLSSKDIGFNAICQLNLGKAYRMVDGKREKYPTTYKQAMNEEWLDYCLDAIKNASNPVVVVTDIFTRVTTGNYSEVLPYREQLGYIYQKLKDPAIKGKIIILARGSIEQSIINNGGPDLMQKLGNMLGIGDRVTNGGSILTTSLKNSYTKQEDLISFAHVNRKINSRTTLAKTMRSFCDENPGFDVYYCTNAKFNWCGAGMTTYKDKDGQVKEKSCWFISFGPMYEYDKFNTSRPEIGPYSLNKNWYKLFTDESRQVRMEYVNYIFPHKDRQDTSNYTVSTLTDAYKTSLQDLKAYVDESFDKYIEQQERRMRKQLLESVQTTKEQQKQQKPTKMPVKKKPNIQDAKDVAMHHAEIDLGGEKQ